MTKLADTTPMMKQYHKMKANYPDAFLFFRLGDFYELFEEDAEKAAQLLEITLTSRNKNSKNPIPMCGVPHHAVDEYIKTLVNQGYKVAIAEQMEDPKLTKGMVKRQVIRVITPGTYLSNGNKENNFICTISKPSRGYCLAYTDISTGEIKVTKISDFETLQAEFGQLQAKEVVFSELLSDKEMEILQNIHSFTVSQVLQMPKQDLKDETFQKLTEDIEDLDEKEALKDLMAYVASTQFQMIDHWQKAVNYEVSHYLHMDYFAKKNLELTESIRTQQKKGSLLHFLDHTQTAMGGRLLRQWLDRPLIIQSQIEQRLDQVEALMNAFFLRRTIQEKLKGVYDLERLVAKVSMKQVNARELLQLKHSLEQVPIILQAIQEWISEEPMRGPIWQPILSTMKALPEVVDLIDRAIDPNANLLITEGSVIRDGFDEVLDGYRQALQHGTEWLATLQQEERQKTGIKSLKVGYNKVFGYYIEVTKANLHLLEEGRYERKQTLTNAERFITPELKEMEYKILEAQEKSVEREYQLFVDVRQKIQSYQGRLQDLASSIAQLDVVQNLAEISENHQFARPQFDEKRLFLKNSRHPVVEETIGRDQFVPNDICMDEQTSILLITGPNMSGKSTYMRQLGLIVIMAQMGCFVPADQAVLPIFDRIFTRIGATDDLQAGQSTFMVEMMEANQAIQHATDRSLLLFDEIGRGTSTYDGIALAQAILEYLHSHYQAKVLFSTHYHELTSLETTLPRLKNIHVGATEQDGDLVFLHKVFEGPADKSYGIHVAKLAGMPRSLLVDAQNILEELEEENAQEETQQMSLFVQEEPSKRNPVEEEVLDQLDQLDLNNMTPIQAFENLKSIQDLLKGESS